MRWLAVAALLCVLSACGASGSPPALDRHLDRVDAAAVASDPEAMETAVDGLLRAVDEAEAAGDLDAARADEIREAARALVAAAQTSPEKPAPGPDENSSGTPATDGDEDDEDD